MATNLAPIFLNDQRVQLSGDPQPKVGKILQAGGSTATNVQVFQLTTKGGQKERTLNAEDVIDRKQSGPGVYLVTAPPEMDEPQTDPNL